MTKEWPCAGSPIYARGPATVRKHPALQKWLKLGGVNKKKHNYELTLQNIYLQNLVTATTTHNRSLTPIFGTGSQVKEVVKTQGWGWDKLEL